mmetsp:Transcript_74051/g.147216  ORF Transcript_74051/g.147216 Transcript_74051/m.147216 type:complete len:225 (+) Transcript_74051:34-708(+)
MPVGLGGPESYVLMPRVRTWSAMLFASLSHELCAGTRQTAGARDGRCRRAERGAYVLRQARRGPDAWSGCEEAEHSRLVLVSDGPLGAGAAAQRYERHWREGRTADRRDPSGRGQAVGEPRWRPGNRTLRDQREQRADKLTEGHPRRLDCTSGSEARTVSLSESGKERDRGRVHQSDTRARERKPTYQDGQGRGGGLCGVGGRREWAETKCDQPHRHREQPSEE